MTIAERLQERMVGLWQINPPYYLLFEDRREAERYSAAPRWDSERRAYQFADGSWGRFVREGVGHDFRALPLWGHDGADHAVWSTYPGGSPAPSQFEEFACRYTLSEAIDRGVYLATEQPCEGAVWVVDGAGRIVASIIAEEELAELNADEPADR
jgi:hypothetical protein